MKKYILKELDKNVAYDISELCDEQLRILFKHLNEIDTNWSAVDFDLWKTNTGYLIYDNNEWFMGDIYRNIVSALELFEEIPPITEVQVDCSNLNKEQIEKMVEIVEKNGYKIATNPSDMLVNENFNHFKFENENNVWFVGCDEYLLRSNNKNVTTITYDQFLKYYGEEKDVNEIEVVYDVVEGAKEIKKLNNEFVRIENSTSEPLKIEIQPGQKVEIRYLKDDSKQRQKN